MKIWEYFAIVKLLGLLNNKVDHMMLVLMCVMIKNGWDRLGWETPYKFISLHGYSLFSHKGGTLTPPTFHVH